MTTVNASRQAAGLPPSPPTLSDEEFGRLIAGRSREALRLARHVAAQESGRLRLTRPLLGEVLHQSTELEELLDAYGARNNECWRPFRSTVAAAKLFADVGYVLLHIQHSTPAYRLLEVEGDFAAATEQTIAFVADVLLDISRSFVRQAADRGIDPAAGPAVPRDFHEYLPSGRLANTLRARKDVDAGETVTYLATAFLNQAAESGVLHAWTRPGTPSASPTRSARRSSASSSTSSTISSRSTTRSWPTPTPSAGTPTCPSSAGTSA